VEVSDVNEVPSATEKSDPIDNKTETAKDKEKSAPFFQGIPIIKELKKSKSDKKLEKLKVNTNTTPTLSNESQKSTVKSQDLIQSENEDNSQPNHQQQQSRLFIIKKFRLFSERMNNVRVIKKSEQTTSTKSVERREKSVDVRERVGILKKSNGNLIDDTSEPNGKQTKNIKFDAEAIQKQETTATTTTTVQQQQITESRTIINKRRIISPFELQKGLEPRFSNSELRAEFESKSEEHSTTTRTTPASTPNADSLVITSNSQETASLTPTKAINNLIEEIKDTIETNELASDEHSKTESSNDDSLSAASSTNSTTRIELLVEDNQNM